MTQTARNRVFEEYLILAARSGDRRAAERLARHWQPRLVRTARRLLRDDEMAREAVQEAWASICRGWLGLRDPARFPAWAFGILHRRCADQLRRKGRQPPPSAEEPDAVGGAPARPEDRLSLEQAFDALSGDHRAAAVLYFCEGLTAVEIAAAVDVPVGTVKSRLHHARARLQAILKGDTP